VKFLDYICGRRCFGDRDDGSTDTYTTTEFVSLLCLPVIPIASYQVPRSFGKQVALEDDERAKEIVCVPLNLGQVFRVYLVAIAFVTVILTLTYVVLELTRQCPECGI
jgi:hypothetical protein